MTSYEPEQAVLYVSPAYEEIWGRKCAGLYDGTEIWADTIHPEDCERVPVDYEGKDEHEFEYRIVKPDGTIRWIQNRVFPVRDETGQVYRLAGVSDDITERKQALEQIKASLYEKDVLLKEIHHRVKNNLQVITSLLQLQSKHITDERARSIFHDSQNRIKSMALIHETLYQSNDLSRINSAEYVRKIIAHVQRSYRVNPEAVRIVARVDEVSLSIDKAVPCGLIINELLSNALKHAFPQERTGEVRVEFCAEGDVCRVRVSEDGVGIPAGMEIEKTNSLGLKLVRTLTGQLGGELSVGNAVGAAFEIVFPE
jgi:PAS domain S-box-containing protein